MAFWAHVDVSSWESQKRSFEEALKALGGRIYFVAPLAGISERKWVADDLKEGEFVESDLRVLDVDLKGVLWTVGLAVMRMKSWMYNLHLWALLHSHAAGVYYGETRRPRFCALVCISNPEYYAVADREGLIVPMENVVVAFKNIFEGSMSGEVFEVGPLGEEGSKYAFVRREGLPYLDNKSKRSADLLEEDRKQIT
ncbi:hypothetical protein CC78DRAFT_564223 [Lojkania enalia]|uniref:Uncharacterized protein n=1 Tax=Lojkania enalia TaxID=147567 RepID=A0A9P4NBN6_9PLEO|nr:hypothetical protein CC78DRAFT_564223 [Didymosphaeria enalia]